MSVIVITEYEALGEDPFYGSVFPAPLESSLACSEVTIGATTTQSGEFNASTTLVVIQAQANCRIKFGTNPTATITNCIRVPQDATLSFSVHKNAAYKVAVIAE